MFHRDAYGCAAHDTCTVTGVDGVDGSEVELAHPDGRPRRFRPSGNAARNLGLYDTSEIEIRAGDRIRWTRNRKAPPARFGREPAPDLINGEQATVVEIGQRSVRFRMDNGRICSISRNDPQLRHIDHAYSTTVHGAQGMTSPRVIAVLEAGGRADQDLLYVEISRASEGFELVVDDRELLAETTCRAAGDRRGGARGDRRRPGRPRSRSGPLCRVAGELAVAPAARGRGRQSFVPGRRLRRGSGADRRAWRD